MPSPAVTSGVNPRRCHESVSEAQIVELSYNANGQLIGRGTTEGADASMTLLVEVSGYPVDEADLPADPLDNTAS